MKYVNIKRVLAVTLAATMVFSVMGCGKKKEEAAEEPVEEAEEQEVGLANPWTETTEKDAFEETYFLMKAPDGATNVEWRRMENGDFPLIEVDFNYEGFDFCARAQYGANEDDDISGMYVDWTDTKEVKLDNWGMGDTKGTLKSGVYDDAVAFVLNWYDLEAGELYCLSTSVQDNTNLDMKAVADAMFDETKVFGYNAPDAESTDAEDATDENADATADQATGTVDQAAIDEAIYAYILDELGKGYEASDVSIPYYEIIDINSDDPEDIRVYGDFWYFTYKINGDTLETQAGGSYPGCIHLKSTTSGVAVTSMDVVEDGSNFDSSAKEIFGDLYNAFIDLHANDEARDQTRTDMIAAYVKKNGLMVTKYQDYGWDPVVFR